MSWLECCAPYLVSSVRRAVRAGRECAGASLPGGGHSGGGGARSVCCVLCLAAASCRRDLRVERPRSPKTHVNYSCWRCSSEVALVSPLPRLVPQQVPEHGCGPDDPVALLKFEITPQHCSARGCACQMRDPRKPPSCAPAATPPLSTSSRWQHKSVLFPSWGQSRKAAMVRRNPFDALGCSLPWPPSPQQLSVDAGPPLASSS